MPSPTAPVRPLPEVLAELQLKGLRRGMTDATAPTRPPVPTGHDALDSALRTAGLPRGSLTLLDAAHGTGATTLALQVLAAAQRSGGLAAYLDLEGSLDAATAMRLGVRLEWLLVVRPDDIDESVELAGWLARSRLIDAFVLDLIGASGGRSVARSLDRLAALLARTTAAGVLLTGPMHRAASANVAGIRIALERRAWLAIGRDLVGQRVEASVARHRWAAPGGRAELDLWFVEGRRTDPLAPLLAVPHPAPSVVSEPALRILSA